MALRANIILLIGHFVLFHTWGVSAQLKVDMEDRVEVSRGKTTQIPCMYTTDDGIGGLSIEWYYVSALTNERHRIFHQDTTMKVVDRGTPFTDRISVNSTDSKGTGVVNLTIQEVQLADELDFVCSVKSLTDGKDDGRTRLRVFETPEFPTIEAYTGIWYNSDSPSKVGLCEAKNGFPKPNITWYKDGIPLVNTPKEVAVISRVTQESSGLFSVKSELSIKVVKEDKDSEFYCEVNYNTIGGNGMLESNRIKIPIEYPTEKISMWVESPKGKIKEGDAVEIHCKGDGYPQPPFTFKHKGDEMSAENNVLMLKKVTRRNGGLYECTALNTESLVETVGNETLFVHFLDPAVVTPADTVVLQGKDLSATCNALSSLETHTIWKKNGKVVAKGHTLKLKDAVYDMAGKYVCVVTVPEIEGMETSGVLQVAVEGPPEIRQPVSKAIETMVEETVNLSCHARGFPIPSITWSSPDAEIKQVSSEKSEDGVLSVVSVKITSDITAFCNASNDHGTDSVAFSIKAIMFTTAPSSTTTSVKAESPLPPKKFKKESSGVIIAVIVIFILLFAILGSVLYFLYKKGKICGRSGKQDLTKEKNEDNIVVEMKSDAGEATPPDGINGEKKLLSDQ